VFNIRKAERKIYGTLLQLADDDGYVKGYNLSDLAKCAGYKASGGLLTYAMEILQRDNLVAKLSNNEWRIFV
jgi:hypothetical protein